MKIRKYICLLFGLVSIIGFWFSQIPSTVFAQSVDNLTIMTENYPPFNFEDKGKLQGIGVDLMVLMLKKVSSNQGRGDIVLLPWARAYMKALKEKNTCLFSTTRTKERENLFKWVGPISTTSIVLIARKDRGVKINATEDIKEYNVGVIYNDIGEQLLIKTGIGGNNLNRLAGTNVTLQAIRMLNSGRIDVWSYEENVAKWEIRAKGFNPNDYETVYTIAKGELYFAFHKDTSEVLIQKLQNALDELKNQGEYQKILDKYLGT